MAQVLIRNLDEDVVSILRERARANGRSLEAELRRLLEREARGEASPTYRQRANPPRRKAAPPNVAREAAAPYGWKPLTDDDFYEDPLYPGVRWPKRPYTREDMERMENPPIRFATEPPDYKPFKRIKVKGQPVSEQIVEERR